MDAVRSLEYQAKNPNIEGIDMNEYMKEEAQELKAPSRKSGVEGMVDPCRGSYQPYMKNTNRHKLLL